MLNARVRELYKVTNGVDEKVIESVFRWFGHNERIENGRTVKMVYNKEYGKPFSGST